LQAWEILAQEILKGNTWAVSWECQVHDHTFNDIKVVPKALSGHTQNNIITSANQGKTYHVGAYIRHIKREDRGLLVDRGANEGIIGGDAWITHEHLHRVHVTGIDNHKMSQIKVIDAAAKAITQKGPIIMIMNQ
jgi:hypothetical protein